VKRTLFVTLLIGVFQSTLLLAKERTIVSVVYIPYLDAVADIDPRELDGGVLFDHSLNVGEATGIKLSRAYEQHKSADVLSIAYYLGRQTEKGIDSDVRSHTVYFEYAAERYETIHPEIHAFGSMFIGSGLVNFDFRNNQSHEWGGAAEIGLRLGLKLSQRVKAGLSTALYLWGYPGETIGHGSYLSTEIGFLF
jgi:hypothetical protein